MEINNNPGFITDFDSFTFGMSTTTMIVNNSFRNHVMYYNYLDFCIASKLTLVRL